MPKIRQNCPRVSAWPRSIAPKTPTARASAPAPAGSRRGSRTSQQREQERAGSSRPGTARSPRRRVERRPRPPPRAATNSAMQQDEHQARAAAPARPAASACRGWRPRPRRGVSFLPTAAAIVTWAIMPVTRISPSDCSTAPRSSEPNAPTSPADLGVGEAVGARVEGEVDRPGEHRGHHDRDQHRHRGDQDRRADGGLGVEADDPERRVVDVAELERPQRRSRRACGRRRACRAAGAAAGYRGGYRPAAVPGGCGYGCWGYGCGVRLGRGRRLPAGRRLAGPGPAARPLAPGGG